MEEILGSPVRHLQMKTFQSPMRLTAPRGSAKPLVFEEIIGGLVGKSLSKNLIQEFYDKPRDKGKLTETVCLPFFLLLF